MKTLFYTLGSILFAILIISFVFRGCEDKMKMERIKEKQQEQLLKSATIKELREKDVPLWVQRMIGESQYSALLYAVDTVNEEEIERTILIDRLAFDTLKLGEAVNLEEFSYKAEQKVKESIGEGWFWNLFNWVFVIFFISIAIYAIYKAFHMKDLLS